MILSWKQSFIRAKFTMRLRLTIKRHDLGDAKVWWETWNETPKPTIASLLTNVNEVFPLESGSWGLEDYVVEYIGHELLHFQRLEDLVGDGDELLYVHSPSSTTRVNYSTNICSPDVVYDPLLVRKFVNGDKRVEDRLARQGRKLLMERHSVEPPSKGLCTGPSLTSLRGNDSG